MSDSAPVLRVVPLHQYVQEPIGAVVLSHQLLCWFVEPGLRCISVWGRPTTTDIDVLTKALVPELTWPQRYQSLVDLRGVTHVDHEAFLRFVSFMSKHREAFSRNVDRSTVVHAGGIGAAVIAGYSRVLNDPFPVSFHTDLLEAVTSCGHPRFPVPELEALIKRAQSDTPVLLRVQAWLSANLETARLAACSEALEMSTRRLQRELQQESTSFRRQLELARVERAMLLLRHTDQKVLAVALTVGFAKVQNLAEAFRRHTGMTPSQWRQSIATDASG